MLPDSARSKPDHLKSRERPANGFNIRLCCWANGKKQDADNPQPFGISAAIPMPRIIWPLMALSFAAGNISLHHSARACSWIPPLYRLGLLRQRCCDTPLRPLDPAFRSPLPHAKHPQFLYSSLQFRVALDQTSLATYYFSTDSLNAHIFKQNPFLAVWNGLSWVWKGKPFQNILQMDG